MELQTLVHTLHGELCTLANLRRQEAEHVSVIAGLIGKVINEVSGLSKTNPKPAFPENDYGNIVTQINSNPNLSKKRKWSSESWARYAIRLSKFVGWPVDAQALRTAFELQKPD